MTACYSTGEGISPPLDRIYFPVGLAADCNPELRDQEPGTPVPCQSKHLYVASSDFDLQYNAGSLQVLDLEVVRSLIPDECQSPEECERVCGDGNRRLLPQTAAQRATVPGPCTYVELDRVLKHKVGIGAFASDVIMRDVLTYPTSDGEPKWAKRLFIPVRGEASLHWLDLDPDADGKPECGQEDLEATPTCDRNHRVGTDPDSNTRNARMPPEPFAIATSDAGDAIVVTHQTRGELSLFVQDPHQWAAGPQLQYVHTLPAVQALAVAAVPEPEYVRGQRRKWLQGRNEQGEKYRACLDDPAITDKRACIPAQQDPFPPGFLVTYGNAARMDLVRYQSDGQADPARPYLQGAQSVTIAANAIGTNSRGLAFDDTERRACDSVCLESASPPRVPNCPSGLSALQCCEWGCANQSAGLFVASRSPPSLITGATTPATGDLPARDTPQFQETLPLPNGPSRVYVGKVLVDDESGSEAGVLETRVFIVCFDARRIIIYDPQRQRIETYVTTGRGPHAMSFDYFAGEGTTPPRALAYVGHFTDSYVGVIQLDRRKIRSYGKMVLSIGPATAPRASK